MALDLVGLESEAIGRPAIATPTESGMVHGHRHTDFTHRRRAGESSRADSKSQKGSGSGRRSSRQSTSVRASGDGWRRILDLAGSGSDSGCPELPPTGDTRPECARHDAAAYLGLP